MGKISKPKRKGIKSTLLEVKKKNRKLFDSYNKTQRRIRHGRRGKI